MTVLPDDLTAYSEGDPQTHIEAATQAVRDYCGWHIAPSQEDVQVIVPTGSSSIFLRSLHVTAIDTITSVGTTFVADEDYVWTADGTLTRATGWRILDPVTVTFTHGYDEFPANVRQVIVALAQRSIDNPSGRIQTTAPGTYADVFATVGAIPMTDQDKDNLAAYKLPGVA